MQPTPSFTLTKTSAFFPGALGQSREPRASGEAAGSAEVERLLWDSAAFAEGFYLPGHV